MNLNKVLLIGRITQDLEKKVLPTSGKAVLSFSMATNRFYTVNNEKKEETDFHNLVAFGILAENLSKYAVKGQLLSVIGRIKTRNWDDKESGKKIYRTEIIIEEFQFGPKPGGASNFNKNNDDKKSEDIKYPEDDVNLEDIPF